jgi:hypothetical protein
MSFLVVGHIEPARVESRIKEKVKDYILKTSRNEEARWPGPHCTVWNCSTGQPINVMAGSYYSINDMEIYLRHNPNGEVPTWVPGALSAVAEFFGILEDPEINEAIIKIAINIAIGLFKSIQNSLAQTFNGAPITHLAINSRENLIAGQYPPSANDPDGLPTWRLHLSGEFVTVDGPDWISFRLQS